MEKNEKVKSFDQEYDSFIFTHIPKCGGTSFRKYINKSADLSGISKRHIYIPDENGRKARTNISQIGSLAKLRFRYSKYKIIAMHASYNMHDKYSNRIENPFYYTILREPIKRYVSHYYFFNFHQGNNDCKGKEIDDLELNFREKLIAGHGNMIVKHLTTTPLKSGSISKSILNKAKDNLTNGYGAFGILESMSKSINLLRQVSPDWINWINDYPNVNINKGDLSLNISDKTKEMIIQYNQLDIELYQFAKQKFELL